MIAQKRVIALLIAVGAIIACQHPSTTPPRTGPAAAPATVAAESEGRGAAGTTLRPRRPRLSPDSLGKLRRVMVNQVLATIVGRENEPAGTVFKNVQYSKDMPAAQFLNMMDSTYGRALGWQCVNCHVTTDFSSDAKKDQHSARLMIEMTNRINKEDMPKISPRNPHVVTCMLCHRGTNDPRDSVETYRMPVTTTRPPG